VPTSVVDTAKILANVSTGERDFVHLFGDALYWTESGPQLAIGRLTRGSDVPERWDVAPLLINDVAVAGDQVVFTTGGATPTVKRGKLGSTTIEGVEEVGAIGRTSNILLDGPMIRFLSADALYTCSASDCASLSKLPTPTLDAPHQLIGLAADATTLWFASTDGRIFGLAK
jgi:hypothetical protein